MATRKTPPQAGARHFGITAPYPLLAGAAAAPESPLSFETEMAKAVRQATVERQARMAGVPLPGLESQQQALPQPVTIQDTLAVNKDAREAAAEQTRLYREAAEDERDRREAAEANAGGAFEAGKKEALAMAEYMDKREERFRADAAEMRKEMQELREQNRTAQENAKYAELKAELDKLTSGHEQEKAELKRRAELAEQRAAEASRPKSREEMALDLIKQGESYDAPHVQVLLRGHVPDPGRDSLDQKWANAQLEAHIDDFMAEIEAKRTKRQREQERQGKMDGAVDHIVDNASKLTDLLRKGAEQFLGVGESAGQGSKAGLPHNGFPGTLDEMAALADQAMGGAAQ